MPNTTELTTQLIADLVLAVAQRKLIDVTHKGLKFCIWYDQAIPVITVFHPEHGVFFEELASDKPEIMSQMLAPWFNGA